MIVEVSGNGGVQILENTWNTMVEVICSTNDILHKNPYRVFRNSENYRNFSRGRWRNRLIDNRAEKEHTSIYNKIKSKNRRPDQNLHKIAEVGDFPMPKIDESDPLKCHTFLPLIFTARCKNREVREEHTAERGDTIINTVLKCTTKIDKCIQQKVERQ